MSTYLHKLKCMDCGLHFIVCSWHEDWMLETDEHRPHTEGVTCPECMVTGKCIRWSPEERGEEIFMFVPGSASVVSLDA